MNEESCNCRQRIRMIQPIGLSGPRHRPRELRRSLRTVQFGGRKPFGLFGNIHTKYFPAMTRTNSPEIGRQYSVCVHPDDSPLRGPVALHADGRAAAGETAVLAFAERSFACTAIPFRKPDAQKYFLLSKAMSITFFAPP